MEHESIFVSIASYRDEDCQHTIKDMYEKAARPERIFAGIFWQIDEQQDQHCFQVPYSYPEQVREIKVPYQQTAGLGWARARCLEMHNGEDYILQIDAHSRFHSGWDDLLIDNLKALTANGSKKPVISQWSISIPAEGEPDWETVNVLSAYIEYETYRPYPRMVIPIDKPAPMVFSSGHFLFSSSAFFKAVPNDPKIVFSFDEFNTALRAWTHGWDIYMLPQHVVAHRFKADDNEQALTLWDDKPEMNQHGDLGAQRYLHLIKKKISDNPEIIRSVEKYGLGAERSLKSFEQYSGLDLTRNTTELFTDLGLASKERVLPDGCSTLLAHSKACQSTRASTSEHHKLLALIKSIGAGSFLDIGCMLPDLGADNNRLQVYTGLDTDDELLARLSASRTEDKRFLFFKLFSHIGTLPPSDLAILDLGRMRGDDGWYFLDLIRRARIEWLIAPYEPAKNMLCGEPFMFPEPEQIFKYTDRLLGLWYIGGMMRRFLYKEPQLIREIRASLCPRFINDFKMLEAKVLPERKLTDFLELWSKGWEKNNEEFDSSGLKQYFIDHKLLDIRNMIFRFCYNCEYDRFTRDYLPFAFNDPYKRHIVSYLAQEALHDWAAEYKIALQFGGNEDNKLNYPLGGHQNVEN